MAIYEDFDLDITTGNKPDGTNSGWSVQCNTVMPCRTDFDTCEDDCSVTCGGVRTMPCDRQFI